MYCDQKSKGLKDSHQVLHCQPKQKLIIFIQNLITDQNITRTPYMQMKPGHIQESN